jgi:epoxyqueuosine reductase
MAQAELSGWVESIIHNFWATAAENSLQNQENDRAFEAPLVGFSSGNDPLYQQLKADIGSFYLTPLEAFQKAFPDHAVAAEELSVISWILPHIAQTKADNARETLYPADRWARGKLYGEPFNAALRRFLVATFKKEGIDAVAPLMAPFWAGGVSERYGIASNWSERHAAYVSGLGTFGLCDGLITPVGKAMRCGSVIAKMPLTPTPRAYSDHHEYCLHFSHGSCGQCIQRCPVGAITENGHDKIKCRDYLAQLQAGYIKNNLGLNIDVCGLCQTGVSCESMIPARKLRGAQSAAKQNS